MSSEQADLAQFQTALDIREKNGQKKVPDKPSWEPKSNNEPDTGSSVACGNCGNHVTMQFARVFGDNSDNISACPACASYREMKNGAFASGVDDE